MLYLRHLYFIKKDKKTENLNENISSFPIDYSINEAEVSQEEQQKVQEISRRARVKCRNSNL